jgi:hypothetical protein
MEHNIKKRFESSSWNSGSAFSLSDYLKFHSSHYQRTFQTFIVLLAALVNAIDARVLEEINIILKVRWTDKSFRKSKLSSIHYF